MHGRRCVIPLPSWRSVNSDRIRRKGHTVSHERKVSSQSTDWELIPYKLFDVDKAAEMWPKIRIPRARKGKGEI